MSRASGAGAYSQGIAWPSPRPQLDGDRSPVGTIARRRVGGHAGHYGTRSPKARPTRGAAAPPDDRRRGTMRVVAVTRVPCGSGAQHRRRRAARRPARRPVGAGRQPARPAPGQSLARRREPDRAAPSRRWPPHRAGADPARRRDRRRRHPGRLCWRDAARRSRRLVDRRHRQPARGPGRGRARPRPSVATTPGLELHVGDGLALPYADRLVRRRPRLDGAPSPDRRRSRSSSSARWPASRGSGSSSTTSTAAGSAGSGRG